MLRRLLFFTIAASIILMFCLADAGFSGENQGKQLTRTMKMPEKQKLIYDIGEQADYFPTPPSLITQSPGDTVGSTRYDYQTNGSTGDRCYLDAQGAVHFSWMNRRPNNNRYVYYNYYSSTGDWAFGSTGQDISRKPGDGYTTITATSDGRAIVAYHNATAGGESLFVAVDAAPGGGFFDYYYPPNRLSGAYYVWPYVAYDQQGFIHVVASEYTATAGEDQIIVYTRSTNGGQTWSSLARVDTVMDISAVTAASPVSNKVAIAYTHPYYGEGSQWMNDVYYIQSTDGTTWNWASGKINVSRYGPPDSVWAYTDLDAVYDYNDNLHIIWNAQDISPVDSSIYWDSRLYHYSTGTGNITEATRFDSLFYGEGCDFGVWNFSIAKMSIGVYAPTNGLMCTYTSWDTTDCSAGGFANGDIYMVYSADGGATWSRPSNLTNSQTPGCEPGDCDSDHWSSLSPHLDNNVHLFYVNDKDPGGLPQTEGQMTDNPMLYYRFGNPLSADGEVSTPTDFSLSQNYPNPFNARTSIEFVLANDSRVALKVYDITGALVSTLAQGDYKAGTYSVSWDASKVASGVYYYTMKANDSETTRKMTLLK